MSTVKLRRAERYARLRWIKKWKTFGEGEYVLKDVRVKLCQPSLSSVRQPCPVSRPLPPARRCCPSLALLHSPSNPPRLVTMSSGAPSVSLYITNLNDAVKKDGQSHSFASSFLPPLSTHSQLTRATPLHVTPLLSPLPTPFSNPTELRRTLYSLFSVYGKVLDVVHTRDPKTRGTAFVVFRDLSSSTSALRALDGEGFFGKQLVSRVSCDFAER